MTTKKPSGAAALASFATNPLTLFMAALVGGGVLLARSKAKAPPATGAR